MITEEKLKKLKKTGNKSKIWNTFKPPQMTQKLNHFVLKSHSNKKSFKLFVFLSIGKSATHRHFKFFFYKKMKRFPLLLDLTYIQRFQQKISRELSVVTFNYIIFFYSLKPNWISFSIFDFVTFTFWSINMIKITVIKIKKKIFLFELSLCGFILTYWKRHLGVLNSS